MPGTMHPQYFPKKEKIKINTDIICKCDNIETTDIRKIDNIYYHELCGNLIY